MEWVVRAGIATPKRLQDGYVAHKAVPGLYGFSVQYHPGLTVDELARAGQFPNGQVSIALDTDLGAAVAALGYAIRLVSSPGRGYHHTFAVLYDAPSGTILRKLPDRCRPCPEPDLHPAEQSIPGPARPTGRYAAAVSTKHMRLSVDFNTLNSEPLDIVKVAADNPDLPPIREGERVTLCDEELEVEATLHYDAASDLWLATPDNATWREIPQAASTHT